MPEYQRFVTYMFRYENGRKLENCGFAKVEVRHQECRIQIQLKGMQGEKRKVYLLDDNTETPTGLFLGSLFIHDGTAGSVFRFASDHIADTDYGINEIRGIYIEDGENRFIASQWDDRQTRWEKFHPWKAEEKHTEEKINGDKVSEKLPEPQEKDSEAEDADTEKKITKPEVQEPISKMTDAGIIQQNRVPGDQIKKSDTKTSATTENPELHATQQDVNLSARSVSETESHIGHILSAWESQWKRFTAAHALFCPFDEDDGVYGVKLRMQDFQILPKQYHYLASNSFLLHGYYNYQMLLFGYMEGEERQWFLGVPGVFSNQEQLLAGIFGFPEFRTKQVTRQKTGEFGYWYRYLDMSK